MAKALDLKPEWLTISTKCGDKEVIYIAPVYFLDEEGKQYYIGQGFEVSKELYKKLKQKWRGRNDANMSNNQRRVY